MPTPSDAKTPKQSSHLSADERAQRDTADQATAARYYRVSAALPGHRHRLAMLEKSVHPAFIEEPVSGDSIKKLMQLKRDVLRAEAERRGLSVKGTKSQIANRLVDRVRRRNPRVEVRAERVKRLEALRGCLANLLGNLSTPTAVEWAATSPGVEYAPSVLEVAYKRLIENGYELPPIPDALHPDRMRNWIADQCWRVDGRDGRPSDDDLKPANWFLINTEVKPGRLRRAAAPDRKTKRVRSKFEDGVKLYCVSDARRWWPDDMREA